MRIQIIYPTHPYSINSQDEVNQLYEVISLYVALIQVPNFSDVFPLPTPYPKSKWIGSLRINVDAISTHVERLKLKSAASSDKLYA